MDYFKEEGGRYVYRPPGQSTRNNLVTIMFSLSIFFTFGVLAFLYFMIRERGGPPELLKLLPAILVVMVPVDIVIMLFLRKRIGAGNSITVDYMNGTMFFNRIAALYGRKNQIHTGEITKISLLRKNTLGYGTLTPSGTYTVRISTAQQHMDVISSNNREHILAAASELASILSLDLDDMTRD